MQDQIKQLSEKTQGVPVTATEPVFNWMAKALGLQMRDLDFQRSIENEVPPSPEMVKTMTNHLEKHKVRLLFYNTQTTSNLLKNLKALAEKHQIPVIGVSEIQPKGLTYHQWMQAEINAVAKAIEMTEHH